MAASCSASVAMREIANRRFRDSSARSAAFFTAGETSVVLIARLTSFVVRPGHARRSSDVLDRDGWKYGPQGTDGRVDLGRQICSSNCQI
jgi:hypothetical protein